MPRYWISWSRSPTTTKAGISCGRGFRVRSFRPRAGRENRDSGMQRAKDAHRSLGGGGTGCVYSECVGARTAAAGCTQGGTGPALLSSREQTTIQGSGSAGASGTISPDPAISSQTAGKLAAADAAGLWGCGRSGRLSKCELWAAGIWRCAAAGLWQWGSGAARAP